MPGTTDIGGTAADGSGDGVAGAAQDRVLVARVSEEPITLEECTTAVDDVRAGAVVTFAGVVRDHDEGRGVTALTYSAHPSADATIREVAERMIARGVLVKDTHGQTIRIAPPLVIRGTELDWAVEQLKLVLAD